MSEEAGRIAGELEKLHVAGAIRSKEDAAFYARFISMFGARFIGWPAKPKGEGARK